MGDEVDSQNQHIGRIVNKVSPESLGKQRRKANHISGGRRRYQADFKPSTVGSHKIKEVLPCAFAFACAIIWSVSSIEYYS